MLSLRLLLPRHRHCGRSLPRRQTYRVTSEPKKLGKKSKSLMKRVSERAGGLRLRPKVRVLDLLTLSIIGAVKATEFDSNITFKEIIDLKREEDVPRALRVWLEKNDITRKGSDGWTPLHEACNAHNVSHGFPSANHPSDSVGGRAASAKSVGHGYAPIL